LKVSVGLRRESVDATDTRAPLTPEQVARLTREYDIGVTVQPSNLRVFSDDEYKAAGADLAHDLSGCKIIFGVSEIPIEYIQREQVYCFFSRTIKAQRYNMPMLRQILESGCTLLDYELVTNEMGSRLIFTGDFAGRAGMIDSFWALGKKLELEGIENPFASIRQTRDYRSLDEAKEHVRELGRRIQTTGLPQSIAPFVCIFTGRGRVSKGAQQIFDLLPAVEIRPDDLPTLASSGAYSPNAVYKVEFLKSDLYESIDSGSKFDTNDFEARPSGYRGKFFQYLEFAAVVVHGIDWTPRYTRLVIREQLQDLYRTPSKLKVIGDLTRDVEGSFESTIRSASLEDPVYVYDPDTGQAVSGFEGHGPVVLAVEKLPAELPRETSDSIGKALFPFVPDLARASFDKPVDELEIPASFKKAVIAHRGKLTEHFRYLNEYLL
jgi:alanine dehydrogenase